jgi:hypothetical protein
MDKCDEWDLIFQNVKQFDLRYTKVNNKYLALLVPAPTRPIAKIAL